MSKTKPKKLYLKLVHVMPASACFHPSGLRLWFHCLQPVSIWSCSARRRFVCMPWPCSCPCPCLCLSPLFLSRSLSLSPSWQPEDASLAACWQSAEADENDDLCCCLSMHSGHHLSCTTAAAAAAATRVAYTGNSTSSSSSSNNSGQKCKLSGVEESKRKSRKVFWKYENTDK